MVVDKLLYIFVLILEIQSEIILDFRLCFLFFIRGIIFQ